MPYYQKAFGKAAEHLKVVLESSPDDKAVGYIVNDVLDGWSGIEKMLIK